MIQPVPFVTSSSSSSSSSYLSGCLEVVVVEGEAEIGDFGPVVLGDQDVSRGEVTVEDLLLLQILHPLASVPKKTEIQL